jgi:hypothetical protein
LVFGVVAAADSKEDMIKIWLSSRKRLVALGESVCNCRVFKPFKEVVLFGLIPARAKNFLSTQVIDRY